MDKYRSLLQWIDSFVRNRRHPLLLEMKYDCSEQS